MKTLHLLIPATYSKNLTGLTIIELLITMSIIALMALFVIPAFSRYGEKTLFQQTTIEVSNMIEQTNIMTKNPEKGATRYFFKMNASSGSTAGSLEFSKAVGTGSTLLKKMELPSDYSLVLQGDATATNHNLIGDTYLVCDSTGSFCCRVAAATTACPIANKLNDQSILQMTGAGLTSTFKIFSNPFRVLAQ